MKSPTLTYLLPLLLFMAISLSAFSSNISRSPSDSTTLALKSEQLLSRVKEINEMDKSDLTRTEKRTLKKEVKGLKKEMKAISGGVYLSVGAIIIIILLLILIL